MKLIYLFISLFIILSVNGQRRTTPKTETTETERHTPSRGRGRSRFSNAQELLLVEPTKTTQAATVGRRASSRTRGSRVTETTERRTTRPTEKTVSNPYEVEETVNESPIDYFKKQSKPRVLTETRFEASNAPKRKIIDIEDTATEVPQKLLKPVDNSVSDTTYPEISAVTDSVSNVDASNEDTTIKTNDVDISSELTKSNEITKEFTKASPTTTTPRHITESRRSSNGARRNSVVRSRTSSEVQEEHSTPASRSRSRTRGPRKPEQVAAAASTQNRVTHRTSRRHPETSTVAADTSKKGPSVFVAEETQIVSGSRTGRRIGGSSPEKITIDLGATKPRDTGRRTPATTQQNSDNNRRRSSSRSHTRTVDSVNSNSRSRTRSREVTPTLNEFSVPTASTRSRFRSRDTPPIIDEQKLEVLPLFAEEPKTVAPVSKFKPRSRGRSTKSNDRFQTSASENDVNLVKPNDISAKVSVSKSQTVSVETRTESSVKEKETSEKPQVKESVIAEVTEVTSKRTVHRRKPNDVTKTPSFSVKVKAGKPRVSVSQVVTVHRGSKKSEVKLQDVKKKKDSSEEITDSDNYPEPFKALIQAKKNKKVSRTSSRPQEAIPTDTNVVTSSTVSSTNATAIDENAENKEDDEIENEVDPKLATSTTTTAKPTRKRFSVTPRSASLSTIAAKRPSFQSRSTAKVVRATSSPSLVPAAQKEHKFHAKFASNKNESSVAKGTRGPSYSRGLYNSRKNKEETNDTKEKINKKNNVEQLIRSTQVPKSSASLKKTNRYSSKYRNDISSRGSTPRSTTNAPVYTPTIPTAAYIPTVPTVTPSRLTVKTGTATKDADLGLEVISFNDPVNTVQSANLVNGEYTSSIENNTVVKEGTTDKPVSIIERIINSITAISTTSPPDHSKLTSTATTTESNSAILKLATKKSTRHDKTKTDETETYPSGTVAYTTEKPTTIIERILSSLSAIQATDDTNSDQVGKDFNTISSPPTTPVSRVTKSSTSSTSLPAQISTSINPLKVLDEIATDDQVLEKRTIGKLLALLNGLILTTESSQKLVVVTPKPLSYVVNVSDAAPNSLTVSDTSPALPSTTASDISTVVTTQSSVSSSSAITSTSFAETPTTLLSESVAPDSSTPQLFTSVLKTSGSSDSLESRITDADSSPVKLQAPGATSTPSNTQASTVIGTTQTEATAQTNTLSGDTVASTIPMQTEATVQTTLSLESEQTGSTSGDQRIDLQSNVIPLSLDGGVTSSTSNTFPTTTDVGITGTTGIDTLYTYLSTIPTLQNFEVSPGSVSIISANDISNSVTPDDNFLTTVTIASRSNSETTATTESTTVESTVTDNTTPESVDSNNAIKGESIQNQNSQIITVESSTVSGGSTAQRIATDNSVEIITLQTVTIQDDVTSTIEDAATQTDMTETDGITTQATNLVIESSTVQGGSGGNSAENINFSSPNTPNTTTVISNVSNQTSANSSNNIELSNRSGRLLNIVEEPIQNSIDVSTPSTTTSTTPDYFVFAVLNNDTILRKKPPTIPNREIPYVVVGFYPNNTVVRKFPNGTLVPMEQIIRVRGFDTRENPPPLPEITSNQVTNDPGSSEENLNVETVDQNTIPSVEANPLALDSVSTTSSAPETNIIANIDTTFTSTSGTTQSATTTTPRSIEFIGTDSSKVSKSSSSTRVDITTQAPSTLPITTVQIDNEFTTPVRESPYNTLATTSVSSTSLEGSTQAPSSMLPALSELFNGRTLEAFNDIISNTNTNTNTDTNYQTLQVNKIVTSTESLPMITTEFSTQAPAPLELEVTSVEMTTESVLPQETTTIVNTVTPAETTTQVEFSTAKPATSVSLSNRILESSPQTIPTTTPQTTSTSSSVAPRTRTRIPTTTSRYTVTPTEVITRATTLLENIPTVTVFPTFPSFLTTLFPNLLRATPEPLTTSAPKSTEQERSETIGFSASTSQPTTIVAPRGGRISFADETAAASTTVRSRRRKTTTVPTTTTTTTTTTTAVEPQTTTTTATTTTKTTTTTAETTTTPRLFISSTRRSVPITADSSTIVTAAPVSSTTPKKLKELTEQQKKDIETLAKLEKEQAALLQQLSFLTSLNFGGNRNSGKSGTTDLANRVVALAVERDKHKTSTTASPPKSIQDQLASIEEGTKSKKTTSSIEDVLKQYNLSGLDISTTPTTASYGKSNDAILAAILKEQGISPSTPKSLADQIKQSGVFEDTTTTRKPRPKTTAASEAVPRPRGRLIQGLNWLLNVLSPQPTTTTKSPRKKKPKKPPVDQELLANSPTRLTPVVTVAPSPNTLSQDDVKKLIKQLEEAQKDPNNKGAIDFTQIKSLENLLKTDDGVQVSTNSQNGATHRGSASNKKKKTGQSRRSTTTAVPAPVSNYVDDIVEEFEDITTAKVRPSLPPLRLRPVAGVDDGNNNSEPLVRSNLITAAVNVTRAISGFLGTALQGAAQSFQSLLGSGSTLSANYAQGSSARPG